MGSQRRHGGLCAAWLPVTAGSTGLAVRGRLVGGGRLAGSMPSIGRAGAAADGLGRGAIRARPGSFSVIQLQGMAAAVPS